MRRTAAVIAITVIGLFLVLSYKSSPVVRTATSPNAGSSTASTAPVGSSQDTGQPAAGPPPAGSGTSSTTVAGSGSPARTIDGSVVSTRYGDVQVSVTLVGSRITDVKGVQLPFDRARSRAISDQVAPILHQEVLDAQSAQVDTVSGATYTSEAYAESLQAALDQAHA